jgi:hypothetical protein
MEIAIPLIALGGMYVVSNQKTKSCNDNKNIKKMPKENFTNMGAQNNYLPNTIIPPQNYPVPNINQLVNTVQEYPNPNVATDKYFNQNLYEKKVRNNDTVENNMQEIYSLTGNYLDSNQFKHNNMVPFNGGKVKGNTYHTNTSETVLDNMIGSGSQVIKKIEQAPLFKPQENMSWAYGTPNQSDFFQSRQMPASVINNVKPFDSVMVGPGLDKGYGVNGTGGYNSGMEARDKWLPYTVDQLRVSTNPKLEYELTNHEGPAQSAIKNVGIQGRVEKQRPDTFFINTQDRWLTTTGATKGETLRPIQETGIIRRNDVLTDYTGPAAASDIKAGYAPTNFENAKRHNLPAHDVNHSTAVGKGPSTDGDNFLKSFTNYENQRSTANQPDTLRSGFSRAVGAVIAPIMDILRPSRKEETVQNARIYGEVGPAVSNSYVINMNDKTSTTIKETTLYSPNFNINNQSDKIYVNNYTSPDLTQRDTTNCQYTGSAGGAASQYGDMNYDAAYRQHNNDIKSATIGNRPNQGGTQLFNQEMNVHINRQDVNRYDGRMGAPASTITSPPSVTNYGSIRAPQYYNECIACDRIQPEILDAFRSNPYTFSLTSSV